MDEGAYLLDNRRVEAGERFAAIAELFDASTVRHFERIGVEAGWRCWEVGAGGTSVPTWLAGRVGAEGRVLATDIDTSWLRGLAEIEVRQHDLVADEAPEEFFDLVHARLVLVHLKERERALRTMAGTLRPGGWLLVEDADPQLQPLSCPDEVEAEQQLANKVRHGFRALLAGRGADLAFGRRLPRLLRAAGLVDVAADVYFPFTSPASDRLEAATVRQLRTELIDGGHATTAELDAHLTNIESGRLDLTTAPMVSAWGRRPTRIP